MSTARNYMHEMIRSELTWAVGEEHVQSNDAINSVILLIITGYLNSGMTGERNPLNPTLLYIPLPPKRWPRF